MKRRYAAGAAQLQPTAKRSAEARAVQSERLSERRSVRSLWPAAQSQRRSSRRRAVAMGAEAQKSELSSRSPAVKTQQSQAQQSQAQQSQAQQSQAQQSKGRSGAVFGAEQLHS